MEWIQLLLSTLCGWPDEENAFHEDLNGLITRERERIRGQWKKVKHFIRLSVSHTSRSERN